MNYKVMYFRTGTLCHSDDVVAKTHKQALNKSSYPNVGHAVVWGNTVKRYDAKGSLIHDVPMFYKTYVIGKPSILVMVGRYSEIYRYENQQTRDEIFEEVKKCIESQSAESAKRDPEQTDTTALSSATSDSKSGLTSKKILSGFVTSATWQGLLTHTSIEKSSGKDKFVATVERLWNGGSNRSRSRSKSRILLAKVHDVPSHYAPYPGANRHMQRLNGTTIQVVKDSHRVYSSPSHGYYWSSKWLDFDDVEATVMPVKKGTMKDSVNFTSSMRRYIGQTLKFHPCGSHYTCPDIGYCFATEWLEPGKKIVVEKSEVAATVKNIPVGKHGSYFFHEDMKQYVGKKLEFTKIGDKNYEYDGWTFSKKWLIFDTDKPENVEYWIPGVLYEAEVVPQELYEVAHYGREYATFTSGMNKTGVLTLKYSGNGFFTRMGDLPFKYAKDWLKNIKPLETLSSKFKDDFRHE